MNSPASPTLICDLDGTLIDSAPASWPALPTRCKPAARRPAPPRHPGRAGTAAAEI